MTINMNTLLMHNDYAELHELCISLKKYKVSAVCLQEIIINIKKEKIRNKNRKIFYMHFTCSKLIISHTPIKTSTNWKPGGTILAIMGKYSQYITSTNSDQMGRWCKATIAGAKGKQLIIYSAYNVVKINITQAGPSKIYAQQWKLLQLAGDKKPNTRQQMIDDINKDIKTTTSKSDYICVAGTFNEILGNTPELMVKVCTSN